MKESHSLGISPTLSAIYNSTKSAGLGRGICAPGTRTSQIEQLLEWARNPEAGKAYWINGMAGTGKTSIAYSLCTELNKASNPNNTPKLGASFFCSRRILECRQVKHIIPTISHQLAQCSQPFQYALDKVLESDPDASTRALKIQFEKLIVQPLLEARESLPANFIVVVDALDECENEDHISEILDLILSPAYTLPIKFIVSSRPEPEIYERMMALVDKQPLALLVLHDLDAKVVKADIEAYMKGELEHIPLTDTQWARIIERCGVLFIYASTVCHSVKHGHETNTLNEALAALSMTADSASIPMGPGGDDAIDDMYTTILTAAFKRAEKSSRMQDLLETIISALEPITIHILATLLDLENTHQVEELLKPLRSVLNLKEATGIVTALHVSFSDFIFTASRSGKFYCTPRIRHAALAESCLCLIDAVEPKFNICGLSSSNQSDDEIEGLDRRVSQAISPSLIYACRYWSAHLCLGEHRERLVGLVSNFFSYRLLVWMEVLNLTKQMRFGASIVRDAENWCNERDVPEDMAKIAHDAWQFVSAYAMNPVCQSTSHIYVSMLPFWPRSRPIAVAYMPRTSGMLEPKGTAVTRRQQSLLATWKIFGYLVYSIGLSVDGTRIAASTTYAIALLDTSTGEEILHINNPQKKDIHDIAISPDGARMVFGGVGGGYLLDVSTGITTPLCAGRIPQVASVAFSPDGSSVAIGSPDSKVYLCSSDRGNLIIGPLKGHTGGVTSVAFSPDGRFIASGSRDKSIRIWDPKSGRVVGNPLEGHTDTVRSVSYYPDGSHLVSGSNDETIRVWDLKTGQSIMEPLKGHSDWVSCTAVSPNGSLIASASGDNSIRLYNAETGQIVLVLPEGGANGNRSLVFSPDSLRLFSSSWDGKIHVWNLQDIDPPYDSCPTDHSDIRCVRYSPDGLRVVSCSDNGTICVWDVQTGEIVLGPLKGHDQNIHISAVDYSPAGTYIASSSWDLTLRLWSAQDGKDIHGPIKGHTEHVNCVRFSPDSLLIVSGSFDQTVRIWDVTSGQQVIEPLRGHSDAIWSVSFSPDGSLVLSGSRDCTIRVWDMRTGQTVIGPLEGHGNAIISIELSPDGSQILSGSWDGTIRTWDPLTGQTISLMGEDREGVQALAGMQSAAFSPDARHISGELILTLEGHKWMVDTAQFSPDGSHVVSCSGDGIRFWDLTSFETYWKGNSTTDASEGALETPMIDTNTAPKSWTMNKNGWVVDQRQQRLLWVPCDLQTWFQPFPNDFVISRQNSLEVKFDQVNIGEKWTNCFRAS
ncbi:unnamed protein product [Rhizoctonia solani]|uniref:NACHT domain-containing protein n=1 Tax=Rhizoctonia solani TaxID=456999 RepID=A0A8H3DF73_9AGAM|nr:unnamed protein product [Rhizoctonia solani]